MRFRLCSNALPLDHIGGALVVHYTLRCMVRQGTPLYPLPQLIRSVGRVLSISSGFIWSPVSFSSPLPPRCSHVMFARYASGVEGRGVTSPGDAANSSSSRGGRGTSGAGGSSSGTFSVFLWGGYASGGAAASSSSMQSGMVEFDVPSVPSPESTPVEPSPAITWRRSQPQGGAAPNPRARFASCVSDGVLWMHGGVCLNSRSFGLFGQSEAIQDEICSFDIESQTWLRVVCNGTTSSPALQAHAITVSSTDSSILLVFGGIDDSGRPSCSLHSIRTLDETRTLKSPTQFALESEREDWRIKFIQEAQNHRSVQEKFQGTYLECEDLKRRLAFLQSSCLNLERELVSRDEQLLRQRSVIQQMQKKSAQMQEQLENERSQHESDAATASSAAAAAAQSAAAAAKASSSTGACELQPHWMSWAWQQLLQANKAAAAAAASNAAAAPDVAKVLSSSILSVDDSDDWLGLGDLLSTQQQQQPTDHSALQHTPSVSAAIAAPAAAVDSDHDDEALVASLTIQNEVDNWIRGVASCDQLGIMVKLACPVFESHRYLFYVMLLLR